MVKFMDSIFIGIDSKLTNEEDMELKIEIPKLASSSGKKVGYI